MQNSIPQQNKLKVAIYTRLSKEDRNKLIKEDDSESIINQQLMLIDYCKTNDWSVYQIYNDEDFSGSDRDRPAFNRMIEDAKNGKFNIILCKTQSRFARDMEIIEKYINGLFPIWGVRFISVVDNADTSIKANRKSRQITSMIDQWMLEDLSENIRATLSTKRKQGLWVGAFAPYGYIKDPKNKNHLIIDKEAAEVVKYVFDLYLQGYGVATIAKKLNAENIPNPATYKKQHNQPFQNSNGECSDIWHSYSVQRFLSNEVYIGNTVQGMTENASYKSNKKRQKPKDKWDIVEGTHEPIIDKDVWDKVQRLRESKPKSRKSGEPNILAKKVRCMECGSSMRTWISRHQRYYRCNTKYFAPQKCVGMTISENVIFREILNQIRNLYNTYVDNNTVASKIQISNGYQDKLVLLNKKINSIETSIEKLNCRLKNIYIDKIDNVITNEEFIVLKEDFSKEKQSLESNLQNIKNEIIETENLLNKSQNQIEIVSKYKDIKELDFVTVNTLIDYIEVGGNRNNRIINIHWNL